MNRWKEWGEVECDPGEAGAVHENRAWQGVGLEEEMSLILHMWSF